MSKFNVGDKVRIVKYGSWMWVNKKEVQPTDWPLIGEKENVYIYDWNSELVGQEGIVTQVTKPQNLYQYSLHGPNTVAWYDEEQLELVEKGPSLDYKRK